MKKQNLKKSKLICLLISIVASVFLWVYVVTVVSTEQSESYYGIPVTFTGLEELREENLTLTEGMSSTVNLRLSGRRTLIQQLNKDNIVITVDVSKINAPGEYSRGYSISYLPLSSSAGISVEHQLPQSISIVVEELKSREIPIKTVFQGSTLEDYTVDSIHAAFDSITVTGTAEQINSIASALIIIDDQDLSKTTTVELPYTLVNADGDPVDVSGIEVDEERVGVTVNVIKHKEIPLIVAFNAGGGATDANVDWEADPKTITISGDEEQIDQINYITLGTQNLSALVADTTVTYPIVVPEGVTNETGITEATVTIKLNGLSTKSLKVNSFTLANVPSGYVANAITQSLEITVRGPSEDVSTITAANLQVVADLSSVPAAAGTYKIENVGIYMDGHPDSGIMGTYTVMVTLMTEDEYLASLAEEANETGETDTGEEGTS